MLRQLLQRSTTAEITLGDEIGFVTNYLDIERARYQHRLVIDVRVPLQLRDALVPSLVLQPLVENAVRHGIGQRAGIGRILVEASHPTPHILRLLVRDNGPGVSTDKPRSDGLGIGLANIRGRLRELYGDDARLDLRDGELVGAEAIVELPFTRARVGDGID
jgi:two-component system LytT family sensor kinase